MALLVVALWPSPPSYSVRSDAAQERSKEKIESYLAALSIGQTATLELTQNELNAWVGEQLAAVDFSQGRWAVDRNGEPEPWGNIRQVGVELEEGRVRTHLQLRFYFLPMTLELDGRLKADAGAVLLEPSGGRVGRLPLWAGAMKWAVRGLVEGDSGMEVACIPANTTEVTVRKGRILLQSI